jgi:hypothetical protein
MELVKRGGAERRTTVTRKKDNVIQRHKRILGVRIEELLKEYWNPTSSSYGRDTFSESMGEKLGSSE